MAFPTLYVDTGGHAQGSGSSDSPTPKASGATGCSVSGTTVQLPGGTDLSAVATDGSDTIFINDATNANQKIFKITAKNDGLDQVTVDVAPTGTISNSAWGIGGQMVHDPAKIESALAGGWIVQFNNSPASRTSVFLTRRTSGNDTDGPITVRGKTGVRPKLTITNTAAVLGGNSQILWHVENLELEQQGASGAAITPWSGGGRNRFFDIKISDAGGDGWSAFATGDMMRACEIFGIGGSGISGSALNDNLYFGNYIHDVGAHGITSNGGPSAAIEYNIIDSCIGRGIYFSSSAVGTPVVMIMGNTIYGCGDSGVETSDLEWTIQMYNNIFSENGDAAGEYNVENFGGDWAFKHAHNVFHKSSGDNLLNITLDTTESTANPLFVDAPNGDFRLQAASPAKAAGFPGQFLGGPLGYMDIGAVQRQEPTGGGGIPRSRVFGGF